MKKALIVRGGRPAHQPVETTEHFRPFLESEGFEITVSDSPKIYSDTEFMASVDLIIQCIESIPPYSEFEDRVSKLKVMCQLYDTYTYILKKKE